MFNIDIEGKIFSSCLPSPLTSEARGQGIQEQALSAQSNKYPTTLRVFFFFECNQSMSQIAAKSFAIDLQRPGFSLDGVRLFCPQLKMIIQDYFHWISKYFCMLYDSILSNIVHQFVHMQ